MIQELKNYTYKLEYNDNKTLFKSKINKLDEYTIGVILNQYNDSDKCEVYLYKPQ